MRVGIAYEACLGHLPEHFPDLEIVKPNVNAQYDLVIFTGGEDVNPALYGEQLNGAYGYDEERDTIEIGVWKKLITGAYGKSTKALGICRGLQLLSVLHGGKLYQDLGTIGKEHHNVHDIVWNVPTPLSTVTKVNSLHHQAVRLTDYFSYEMNILATEPKTEIVEALSSRSNRMFGVQFHPEFFKVDVAKPFFDIVKKWVTNSRFTLFTSVGTDKKKSGSDRYARYKSIFDFETMAPPPQTQVVNGWFIANNGTTFNTAAQEVTNAAQELTQEEIEVIQDMQLTGANPDFDEDINLTDEDDE